MSNPKYLHVSEQLYAKAMASSDKRLPSERDICQLYGVSRITAKKALDVLSEQGLVTREVGRGTYLKDAAPRHEIVLCVMRGNPELMPYFEEEAKLLETAHPGTRIQVKECGDSDFLNAVTEARPNQAVILCAAFTGYLSKLGLLTPLNTLSNFTGVINQQHGDYARWTSHRGESSCFALPFFLQPTVFGFNHRYAKELGLETNGPKHWADIIRWAQTAKQSDITSTLWTTSNTLPYAYALSANGGKHILHENDGTIESQLTGCKQALSFFKELFDKGAPVLGKPQERSHLVQGKSLFELEVGPWAISQAKSHDTIKDLTFMPVPSPNTDTTSFSPLSSWNMSLARSPQCQESTRDLAWQVIQHFCATSQPQERLLETFSCIAMDKAVFQSQQQDPAMLPFITALATSRLRTDNALQHPFYKQVMQAHKEVLLEDKPLDVAYDRLVMATETVLSLSSTDDQALPLFAINA